MASTNKRDVRLAVEIETAGEENLKRIAAEVRALAQAGGDAAPQYIELANAIERNADVARELAVFKTAAQAIEQTSAAAEQATAAAQRLRQEYDQQAATTQELQANQARVAAALGATKRELLAAAEQAAIAKNALRGADDSTGELARTATAAADKVAGLKKRVGELGLDLKDAKAEAAEAAQALRQLADQSLRADEASRSAATALRSQVDTLERARSVAAQLGADFTDVAAAQERLDAALRDGAGAIQAAAAAEKLAAEQRAAQAAVDALTADLDKQAEAVRGKLVPALLAASEAYDKEQAAIRESLALAEREAAEAAKRAALQQRLTQLREEDIAILRGETAERERAKQMADSEQASIRESEQFLATYNQRKQQAAADALEFVQALEKEEVAARNAAAAIQKANDDLERTRQGRQYVVDLAAALDAAEKQAAQAAAEVAKLQGYFDKLGQQRDVVSQAFGTTGVRSIQAIEQEMFKLQRALITLQTEFSEGRISVADFERATGSAQARLAALKREIETVPGQSSVFNSLADGANNLITKFGALTAALATVGFAIKPVIDSFIALESTTRILTQVTGSSVEAARQIEFLRKTAQQSGQSFTEVSQSYAKFAASALQAGLSTEQVQATFKSVALAAGNLGLSSDQAKRALEALGQIASKGTVSMEELRQQLGDALPGALPLLAKELGLTNKELNKLVESGQGAASDAIPAIAKALQALGPASGKVEGLVASFNRFINGVKEAGTIVAESSIGQTLGLAFLAASKVVLSATYAVATFAEGLTATGKIIGEFVYAAVNRDFSTFGTAVAKIADDSGKKLDGLAERVGLIQPETDKVAQAMQGLAGKTPAATAALASTGQAAAAAAPGMTAAADAATAGAKAAADSAPKQAALGDAIAGAGTAAAAAAPKQQAAADATTNVANAAAGALKSVPQLQVAYQNLVEAAKAVADTAKLAAEAKKTEGEAAKEAVALTGNEILVKQTAARVAGELAVAVAEQAAAEQRELDIKRQGRDALVAAYIAQGTYNDEKKKSIAVIDDALAKEAQAVQKTIEQAEALQRQAQAAQLAAESQQDNSKRTAEFAAAAEQSAAALERARVALAGGTITARQYRDAAAQAAFDQGKLNDAIGDSAKRLETDAKQQAANNEVRAATIKIRLEELRNVEAKARADGDETRAAQAKIEVKKAELEITRLNHDAKRQEAQATVDSVQYLLREADAGRNELTPEKRAELEARLSNAQAKLREAEAAIVSEKRDEAEIERLKRLRFAIEDAAKARDAAAGRPPSPSQPTLGGINQQRREVLPGVTVEDVRNDPYGRSAEQIASLKKQGGPVDNSYVFSLLDRLKRGDAFAASEIPNIQAALRAAETNARLTTGSSVQGLNGLRGAQGEVAQLRAVLARAQGQALGSGAGATGTGSLGAGFSPAAPAQAAVPTASDSGRTVNINLAGLGSTSIRVASDADAAKIEALLRSIETASARSGG